MIYIWTIMKNIWKVFNPYFWKAVYELISCVLYSIKLHIDRSNMEKENIALSEVLAKKHQTLENENKILSDELEAKRKAIENIGNAKISKDIETDKKDSV